MKGTRAPGGGPTVLVLMGVSGVGKSTVGRLLAERLGWRFYDADDFHPASNIEKMESGDPLTDADRAPWLDALRERIEETIEAGESAVVACSALRRSYRGRLREGDERIRFIYLKGSEELVRRRIERRVGHFFDPQLLQSQFEALEEPENAMTVEVAPAPQQVVEDILTELSAEESGTTAG